MYCSFCQKIFILTAVSFNLSGVHAYSQTVINDVSLICKTAESGCHFYGLTGRLGL